MKNLLFILIPFLLIACSNESIEIFSLSSEDCKKNWSLCEIAPSKTIKISTTKKIKVAVLDSGIDESHPLLKGKVIKSYDAINGGSNTNDSYGHGTAIAGIIAAAPNNQTIQGIFPYIELYDVKVLNDKGGGKIKDLVNGIKWSIKQEVDIINLSFGFQKDDRNLKKAIDEAYAHNITIIAAAGNTLGLSTDYPARYKNVISVSSIDKEMKRDIFAAKGKIDFVAPGVDIPVLTTSRTINLVSGTSFSTAYVTGIVASYLAQGEMKKENSTLLNQLKEHSKDLGDKGPDNKYGYGLLQLQEN